MSNQVTRKFVEEGFGYLNAKNLDAFFALYSEDVKNPSLANMGLPTNKAGFKQFVNGFYASFSEPQFLPQIILCEGDRTMFYWIFKGRHTGDFAGVKPTGKSVSVDGFTTFRLGADGKVIEQYELGDMMTLMRQLGAVA